ncbi:MAG: hypothetical protein Q4P05_00800 [Actinomycetaceae bacterium]|nr:hypothetical protein [Actinomycetaceae bacterium]
MAASRNGRGPSARGRKKGAPGRAGSAAGRGPRPTPRQARPQSSASTPKKRRKAHPNQQVRLSPAAARRQRAIRQLYIRRVLSILALVAILVGIYFIGRFVWNSVQISLAQHADSSESVDDVPEPITDCAPQDLTATMTNGESTAIEGQGWSTHITLTNTSDTECTTDGALKSVGFAITSGDVPVYDTTQCADQDAQKLLLLGPGRSWTTTVSWDGRHAPNCDSDKVAAPGTYVMALKAPRATGNDQAVVVIEPAPPPPEPSEDDESSDDSQSTDTGDE